MKWFHHDCSAKHDPKLLILGEAFGAEGIGVYWGLLEEIGHHSDTFHIKVTGVSAESDQAYIDDLPAGINVPTMPLRILARLLFTTEKKLQRIIEKLIEVDLIDGSKWRKYGILYSAGFEQRADDYTRRRRRTSENVRTHSEHYSVSVGNGPESLLPHDDTPLENVRTLSGHCPADVRHQTESSQERDSTCPENVRPEQTTEQKEIQKERQSQKEKENRREMFCSVPSAELSTAYAYPRAPRSDAEVVLVPSTEYFDTACTKFREIIRDWNEYERSHVDWVPTDDELKKLFYGGDSAHKLRLCREATNLMGGRREFPRLVIRALSLMLEASKKQRIQNPFGWVWSCLHGTPEGIAPWVHLPTAPEEARRIASPRSPP